MANLVELFDNIVQMQNLNGVPLAAGKLYVFALGRTRLMDTWSDVDGESLNPNPIILDDAGQAHVYVSDAFDYTLVVCDQFDNEIFSVDKYLLSKGEHSHADVAVAPSEHIGVSSYHVGEVTVYVPYLTGEVGKTYEGIDPIVVNNTLNRISANHIPLGVQDPLYFVEDSETACVIGIDSSACGKTYSGISPILVDNTANTISITGDIGKDWTEEILSAANDASAAATAWTDSQGYLTGVDLSEYAKESFVISAIDSSTSGLLPTSAFATASGSFITALPSDLATTGWVDSQGYLTAVDIPESAVWNATTQTVSANSAQWAGGTANPQIPVTGINGIKISESGDKVVFEVSANYATEDWVTGQGYLTAETDWTNTITAASANAYNEATAAIPTGLATTGDLQNVSGEITALIPSTAGLATEDFVTSQGYITNDAITGKQDITGMTAYATVESLTAKQDAGDYLSASDSANFLLTSDSGNFYTTANESGFITGVDLTPYQLTADMVNYQTTAGMTGYQSAGDYLTTGDSANFYTTANESGFISEVPAGTMNESAFSYDASDNITAYNGSAFKAGDEFPQSATEAIETVTANSADWNGTTETVNSNSGVWGGSALPISAGPGIKFEMVDNTLVASVTGQNNETVLWESNSPSTFYSISPIQLSENVSAFERIMIIENPWPDNPVKYVHEFVPNNNLYYNISDSWIGSTADYTNPWIMDNMMSFSAGDKCQYVNDAKHRYNSTSVTGPDHSMRIYKVIGINRTAGGN